MANRYWVGGTATWDATNTTNWSASSGGAGGASVPTSADDVFFDANSGAGTVTITTGVCLNFNSTGFTGAFSGTSTGTLDVYASLTIGAANAVSPFVGTVTMRATSGSHTITTNARSIRFDLVIDGAGGTFSLADSYTTGDANASFCLSAGSFNTNNFNMYVLFKIYFLGTGAKIFNAGSSTLQTYNWSGSASNLTFNAGTSTITGLSNNALASFIPGNISYYTVDIAVHSAIDSLTLSAGTYVNLTLRSYSLNADIARFLLSGNQTVTGTFSAIGYASTERVAIKSSVFGTQRTITAASVSISNADFQDIIGAGAGSWTGTSVGDCHNNSGITFTTPVTRYAVAAGSWNSTAVWSASSGGASGASAPLPQDTAVFNAASGAITVTLNVPRIGSIVTTGFTGTLTCSFATDLGALLEIYGDVTWTNTWTFTNNSYTLLLSGRNSTYTITQVGGGNYFRNITVRGSYQLGSDLTTWSGQVFTVERGSFNSNGYGLSVGRFIASGSNVRTVTLDTYLEVSGVNTVIDLTGTNLTGTFTGCDLRFDSLSGDQTLNSNGFAFGDLLFVEFIGSPNVTTITGSNSFTGVSHSRSVAFSVFFTAGTTTTFDSWSLSGSAGKLVTISSSSAAGHNLVFNGTTGGYFSGDYLNISYSNSTPVAGTWYAGANSTDGGNNSGWIFTTPNPLVSTLPVTNIDHYDVDFNGEITDLRGGGNATVRGFKYRTVSTGGTPTAESFESNTLGVFANDPASKTGWVTNSGATGSSGTGASAASAGTYYVYVETSNGSSFTAGDTDIMEAPCGAGTLTFDYHQYGANQGTLYVDYWNGTSWVNVWSSTGDQGNQWNAGSVSIPIGASKLRFRNVAAGGFTGDICLDNISIPEYSFGTESVVNTSGSYGTGAYTINQGSLGNPQAYQVRAYATSPIGTGHGEYVLFQTLGFGIAEGEMFSFF